jgi:hypothetical protein
MGLARFQEPWRVIQAVVPAGLKRMSRGAVWAGKARRGGWLEEEEGEQRVSLRVVLEASAGVWFC